MKKLKTRGFFSQQAAELAKNFCQRHSKMTWMLFQPGTFSKCNCPDITVKCVNGLSQINTEFFVDHEGVPEMVQRASGLVPWLLGELPEGWEWFAFTFFDQQQIPLGADELKEMLRVSDESTHLAYARMTLNEKHVWHKYVQHEAEFVWTHCNLRSGSRVFDIGCGDGRHVLALAQKGVSATGADYVESRIESAKRGAHELRVDARFLVADARDVSLGETFDCVLCLYDVVGSHADNADNLRIVETVAHHVERGGFALISVMNFELTEHIATQTFSIACELLNPARGPGVPKETMG